MRTGGESERLRAPFLSLSPPSLPRGCLCSLYRPAFAPAPLPPDWLFLRHRTPHSFPSLSLARANLRRPFHIHTLPYSVPPPAPSTLSSTIKKHLSDSLIASGFAPSSAEHQDQESAICWPSSPPSGFTLSCSRSWFSLSICSPIPRHLPASVLFILHLLLRSAYYPPPQFVTVFTSFPLLSPLQLPSILPELIPVLIRSLLPTFGSVFDRSSAHIIRI